MHLEKVANGSEHSRCRHNARLNKSYSNENIDLSKTKHNRNLTEYDGRSDMERFKDRLNCLSYRKQKNNVRMEEIVITAPKNIPFAEIGNFFDVAHAELQKLTGGYENEVSAWVHLDEKTPHMHYLFVPGIEVDGVMKLSAKRLMDRNALRNLHPAMQSAIDRAFGSHEYLVVADNPKERMQHSDTIKVFKSKMAALDSMNQEYGRMVSVIDDNLSAVMQLELDIKSKQNSLDSLIAECDKRHTELDSINQAINDRTDSLNVLIRQNTALDDNVNVETAKLRELKDSIKQNDLCLRDVKNRRIKESNRLSSLKIETSNMQHKLEVKQHELDNIQHDIDTIRQDMDYFDYLQTYFSVVQTYEPDLNDVVNSFIDRYGSDQQQWPCELYDENQNYGNQEYDEYEL